MRVNSVGNVSNQKSLTFSSNGQNVNRPYSHNSQYASRRKPTNNNVNNFSQGSRNEANSSSKATLGVGIGAALLSAVALGVALKKGKGTGDVTETTTKTINNIAHEADKTIYDFTNALFHHNPGPNAAKGSAELQAYEKQTAKCDKLEFKFLHPGQKKHTTYNIKDILQNSAKEHIYNPNIHEIHPRNGSKAVVWMPTSEDLKITKKGGLAEVPPQLAEAWAKNDVATPVIISPLYKDTKSGTWVRRFANGEKTVYDARGFKSKPQKDGDIAENLDKLLSFKMDVVSDKKKKTIDMEVFQCVDTIKGPDGKNREIKRILLGTDSKFDDIYAYDMPMGEEERFGAVFGKGVYEFRKIVEDMGIDGGKNGVKDITFNADSTKEGLEQLQSKLDALKPDATVLNDWHASSLSALYRIQAPIEAAEKTLDPKIALRLKDENVTGIFHNAIHQGNSSGNNAADIMNTLFGENATYVAENAKISYTHDPAPGVEKGSEFVFKLKGDPVNGKETSYNSLLHMAAAFCDRIIPVSEHYGEEIATSIADTKNMRHILKERFDVKAPVPSLKGIANGNERSGLILDNNRIKFIKGWNKGGVEYEPFDYSPEADLEKNLAIKTRNKRKFIDWLKQKTGSGDLKTYKEGVTKLSDLDKNNIGDVPIVMMGSRVSNQKGFDVAKEAIIELVNDYETKYPGKQQPLIVIGGEAEDDAAKHLADLKNELGEKGKRVVAVNDFVPNPVLFPVSDILIAPSHSEPCGLVQQPIMNNFGMFVGSKIGGHVDTVRTAEIAKETGKPVTGILKPINEFSEGLKEAFDMLHNKPEEFKAIQLAGSKEDFSWVVRQKDGTLTGPAIDHAKAIGIDTKVAEKKVTEAIKAGQKSD